MSHMATEFLYHCSNECSDLHTCDMSYRATLKNRVIYSECATLYKYALINPRGDQ